MIMPNPAAPPSGLGLLATSLPITSSGSWRPRTHSYSQSISSSLSSLSFDIHPHLHLIIINIIYNQPACPSHHQAAGAQGPTPILRLIIITIQGPCPILCSYHHHHQALSSSSLHTHHYYHAPRQNVIAIKNITITTNIT